MNGLSALVILCAVLGSVASPTANAPGKSGRLVGHHDQISMLAKLRGSHEATTAVQSEHAAFHNRQRYNATVHKKKAIVALQAKDSIDLQSHITELSKRSSRTLARREKSYFNRLLTSLRHQAVLKQRARAKRVDMCNGNQYGWMVSIRQGCKDSYGDESVWDNSRAEGACRQAWDECNSDFSSNCCTQPEGPRNMDAYCASQNGTQDRACAVQGQMAGVQGVMQGIRDAVALMDTRPPWVAPTTFTVISGDCTLHEGGRCVASPGWPEDYEDESECELKAPSRGVVYPRVKIVSRQFNTESCCDKLTIGNDVFSGDSRRDGPDDEVLEGHTDMKWESDYSGASSGWKVCAEDIPPPPAPPPPAMCWSSAFAVPGPSPGPSPGPVYMPCPSPGPGPMMPGGLGPSPAPHAHLGGAPKLTKLQVQCAKLTDLVAKAARSMDAIHDWAVHDGIAGEHADDQPATRRGAAHSLLATIVQVGKAGMSPGASLLSTFSKVYHASSGAGTSEAKDPDLTFAMQRVLAVRVRLNAMRDAAFCGKKPAAAAHVAAAGGPSPGPAGAGDGDAAGAGDGDDDGDDDDDDDEDDEMEEEPAEVNGTAVGELLEFDQEMEGAAQGFEKGVHPHGNKWWRYRYEYTLVESLVLAFSVMLLFFVMYLLHGVSFFDRFKFYNIGLTSRLYRYCWAYVVFHSAALMVMVTLAYMLYMPWGPNNIFDVCAKAFHEFVDGRANVPFLGYSWLLMVLDVQFQLFCTFMLYAIFILFATHNFARALEDWKAICDNPYDSNYRMPINDYHYNDFREIMLYRVQNAPGFQRAFNELKLRLEGVGGIDQRRQDLNEFRLHLYLTEAFGKALEYLCEVSLKSIGFLAVSALVIALLAHHYQVAFMYFLPIFIFFGVALFSAGYFLARKLRFHDHGQDLDHYTVHTYCRMIQISLYCIFFSFARLLLSSDIFTDYPKVYMGSFFGLSIMLFLAWLVAGEVMKATILRLVLPHDSEEDRFKNCLQHVAYWYSTENCHECGVRQAPSNASISREWAGQKGSLEHMGGTPSDVPSGRDFSFRG